MYPTAYRPYAVRVETAAMGSDAFLDETVHVLASNADAAQDLAITHIEARGSCHRHVLSVRSLEN